MRKFKLALIAATSAIAITSGAYAADASDAGAASTGGYAQGSGWYVSGSTGLAFLENAHNKANGYSFDSFPSNPGFDVTGAIGKEFGNGFRARANSATGRSAWIISPFTIGITIAQAATPTRSR